MTFSVIIVGGGIGGLTAAIALGKLPGVGVNVYEQAPELKEVGATIALGPNGLRTLEKLGVDNALSEPESFKSKSTIAPMVYRHWKTGQVLSRDWHHGSVEHRHRTSRFHRAHLHEALQEHVPKSNIHLGKRLSKLSTNGNGVSVVFEDGTTAKGDLLVGADGLNSSVRKHFVPEHELGFNGDVALRTVFPRSLLKGTDGDLNDSMHFVGPDRGLFASPLGRDLFSVVGWVNTSEGKLKNDAQWDAPTDPELIRTLYKDWHPAVRAITNAAQSIRLYPNRFGDPLKSLVFDEKVALIGDAGHCHGGAFAAGGSLSIDDAYALYLSLRYSIFESKSDLSSNLGKSLERYNKTRLRHVNSVIYASRTNAQRRINYREGKDYLTEEAIRTFENSREDPFWIHEHDVEAEFTKIVWEEINYEKFLHPKSKL